MVTRVVIRSGARLAPRSAGYVPLGRPDWSKPRLAPTGDRLAAVRWHDGAANLWVGSGTVPMQLASDLRHWRLRDYRWAADGQGLIVTLKDPRRQRPVLAWLDLSTGSLTILAADARYAGQVGGPKPRILMAVHGTGSPGSVLQAVTTTGEVLDEWRNPGGAVNSWLATATQAVAVRTTASSCSWWHGQLADRFWQQIAEFPAADALTSRPLAFGTDGSLFATSSAGRDTIALIRLSPPSWTPEVLSERVGFDLTSVLMSPDGSGPDIVTTTDPADPQSALTSAAAADLSRLRHLAGSAPARIIDRNASHCLATVSFARGGPAYVLISRTTQVMSKPLVRYTSLNRTRVCDRESFSYQARDGRSITGLLTRPGSEPPWPVVLVIHDGPWGRDDPEMDPWAQQLASAGLCCVQVNYRGSCGFGRAFCRAAQGQWALAMQADLVDAIRSEPVATVADPHNITAMGHGYGGYAALMLATQCEVPLAAAVSASAPTDLVRYVNGLLSFGDVASHGYAARIGDPAKDRDKLNDASPVNRAADIGCPLLLFHGVQDVRVPVSHATGLRDALRYARKPHELVIYEDEGHWFSRPQNIADFGQRSVAFLLGITTESAIPAAR